jgi:hypothetical protein
MKKSVLLVLSIFLISIFSISVLADGGMFVPPGYSGVTGPEQKAIIEWDGTTEILTLSTKIKTNNLTDIAWVVPIKSNTDPKVEEGDISKFKELSKLFQENKGKSFGGTMAIMDEVTSGIQIVSQEEIDIYDITVLKATNANSLVNWLNDNGYSTPESSKPILQKYS